MNNPLKNRLRDAGSEAPGPWRIGDRNHTGIQVLDANGKLVATISTAPLRSEATLEAIQELIAGAGNKVVGQRFCANPACRRPFNAPSRKQRHCSNTCANATQPTVIEARDRARRAYELRSQGLTYGAVAERCGYISAHRARSPVLTNARRNGLPVPTPTRLPTGT